MGTENVLPISVDRNAVGDRESIGQSPGAGGTWVAGVIEGVMMGAWWSSRRRNSTTS